MQEAARLKDWVTRTREVNDVEGMCPSVVYYTIRAIYKRTRMQEQILTYYVFPLSSYVSAFFHVRLIILGPRQQSALLDITTNEHSTHYYHRRRPSQYWPPGTLSIIARLHGSIYYPESGFCPRVCFRYTLRSCVHPHLYLGPDVL